MSTHFDRGVLLYQQDRHAQAEHELGRAVAEDPDSSAAHAFLALCLAEQGKLDGAEDEARAAVRCGPDDPFAHLALAQVLYKRDKLPAADRAARESLRLDPSYPSAYAILAAVRHDRQDFEGALRAAEDGLARDPDHRGCAALRTMALLKLGRTDDAVTTAGDALRRGPDDALAHTAQGWALLQDRRPADALPHFREALRLDPTSGWARDGMVAALKARYWVYRQMLGFFLWMGRLGQAARVGVLIGLLVAQWGLGRLADAVPAARPFAYPALLALIGFVVLTWVADPLFNLLLRLNRFGRHALTPDERRQSAWVGACVLAGVVAVGLGAVWLGPIGYTTAFGCLFLLIPVSAVFRIPAGWPRRVMAGYAVGMAGLIGGMDYCFADAVWEFGRGQEAAGRAAVRAAWQFFDAVLVAGFLAGFLANGLGTVRR
jgi:tetratricopeptide (TPR) repeat protein